MTIVKNLMKSGIAMKIKVYVIYFNGEVERTFITRKSAIKYIELLDFYKNKYDSICLRKEYIYV